MNSDNNDNIYISILFDNLENNKYEYEIIKKLREEDAKSKNVNILDDSNTVDNLKSNTSTFLNKIENVDNPSCDIENIFTDPNCNDTLLNSYKNYITNMNNFCLNTDNILKQECIDFYKKKFVNKNDSSIILIPDKETKNNEFLNIITKTCDNNINYSNTECHNINKDNQTNSINQLNFCKDNKDLSTCKDLCSLYDKDSEFYTYICMTVFERNKVYFILFFILFILVSMVMIKIKFIKNKPSDNNLNINQSLLFKKR